MCPTGWVTYWSTTRYSHSDISDIGDIGDISDINLWCVQALGLVPLPELEQRALSLRKPPGGAQVMATLPSIIYSVK